MQLYILKKKLIHLEKIFNMKKLTKKDNLISSLLDKKYAILKAGVDSANCNWHICDATACEDCCDCGCVGPCQCDDSSSSVGN